MDQSVYSVQYQLGPEWGTQVMELYAHEWWSKDRNIEETHTVMYNSTLTIGIIERSTNTLVAFSRCITDRIFKAIIFDVIVRPSHRGKDLGDLVIQKLITHPLLTEVQHIELYCKTDKIDFYKQFGFKELDADMQYMRLTTVKKPTTYNP